MKWFIAAIVMNPNVEYLFNWVLAGGKWQRFFGATTRIAKHRNRTNRMNHYLRTLRPKWLQLRMWMKKGRLFILLCMPRAALAIRLAFESKQDRVVRYAIQ